MCVCLSHAGIVLMMQSVPHDSPGTIFSDTKDCGIIPMGVPNAGGVGSYRRLLTNNSL